MWYNWKSSVLMLSGFEIVMSAGTSSFFVLAPFFNTFRSNATAVFSFVSSSGSFSLEVPIFRPIFPSFSMESPRPITEQVSLSANPRESSTSMYVSTFFEPLCISSRAWIFVWTSADPTRLSFTLSGSSSVSVFNPATRASPSCSSLNRSSILDSMD